MRGIIFAALGLIAVPASAQQTNCRWVGSTWTCNSAQPIDQGSILRSGQQAVPDYNDMLLKQRQAQLLEAQTRQLNAGNSGAMTEIWARCRKRWNEALEKRDFELADALVKGCPATP